VHAGTRDFWVCGSGTLSERYMRWTSEAVGTERMMYSTDYPYTFGTCPGGFPFLDTANGVARSFLEQAPFTHEEKAAIGSGNWEGLPRHVAASLSTARLGLTLRLSRPLPTTVR
jgi:uncharacterized protein